MTGSFGYNDHLQLSSLAYTQGASTLLNLTYNYLDANGNNNGLIQGITDSRGDDYSTLYFYDGMDRLVQAQTKNLTDPNTWNVVWQYDRYGNRISQSAGTPPGTLSTGQPAMTFDEKKNRFISPGSGFSYDQAGNVIGDPGAHAYTYNAEGELIAVDGADFYAYDGHRWKMQQTVSGATTTYIYSGSKVLAEYPAGVAPTAPSKEYIYAGTTLLATIAGGATTYQYPDQLSTRVETDSADNVTRTFGHLPFGEIWYETGTASKWKFTSYEPDTSEPQLDYAMNRFYAYGFGRFQSPDPYMGSMDVMNPQSMNRYAYVGNNPQNLADPSGLNQVKLSDIPKMDWSCTRDGLAAPCSFVSSVISAGAGGECPNNDCSAVFTGPSTGFSSPMRVGPDGNWEAFVYIPGYTFTMDDGAIYGVGTGGWVTFNGAEPNDEAEPNDGWPLSGLAYYFGQNGAAQAAKAATRAVKESPAPPVKPKPLEIEPEENPLAELMKLIAEALSEVQGDFVVGIGLEQQMCNLNHGIWRDNGSGGHCSVSSGGLL